MSSWFQSTFDTLADTTGVDLTSAFDTLTETVQNVSDSVQESIPKEHKEFLAKITLNTDEMISERDTFRQESSRKAYAKDRLNKILPWETLDPEQEILVEECKEAILELTDREETFFGPYEMPLLKVVFNATEEDDEEEGTEEREDGTEENDDGDDAKDGATAHVPEDSATTTTARDEIRSNAGRHMAPSEESLEMLKKLEPLPPLLKDFDLEVHVGLIQRVMEEDPKLVAMQANFSGGGLREKTFWHNYFFHCAFTRYTAGLSLEEIWSYGEESSNTENDVETTAADGVGNTGVLSSAVADSSEEETVDGQNAINSQNVEESATVDATTVNFNSDAFGTTDASPVELSELSPTNGFQLIDDDEDGDGSGDPELDELEAEIARELENL